MKYAKRILAFVLVLVLCITIMPMTSASAKSRTRLNKKKATVYVGRTVKLKVKYKPAGKKVKWKSTNKKVATVKKGKVKAKKSGKATIIVKVGKKKYKCRITVKKRKNNTNPIPEQTPPNKYDKPTEKPVQPTAKPVETTKPQEVTTKAPETTKPIEQPTTAPINFTTDSSIEKPFGMVVTSPENGMVSVVWGKGNINCYNVYVDGERRRTAVPAARYTMPVYFEGTHTIAVTTVVDSRESLKIEMQITVAGVGEKETEPETCPEELKPQLRDDIKLRDDRVVLQLNNKTNGKYTDKQIYWCLLGYNKAHQLCYLDKNGNLIPASPDMNTITVNNRLVADVSNTLEEAGYVYAPSIESGRLYISYEKPVYIAFNNAADGTIGFATGS